MMMETVVYAANFCSSKSLYEKGELGKIQFLQACHQQDMDGWPDYWPGLPPMHYATHCVGPVSGAAAAGWPSTSSCFGSGTIREDLAKKSQLALRGRDRRISSSRTADLSALRLSLAV